MILVRTTGSALKQFAVNIKVYILPKTEMPKESPEYNNIKQNHCHNLSKFRMKITFIYLCGKSHDGMNSNSRAIFYGKFPM